MQIAKGKKSKKQLKVKYMGIMIPIYAKKSFLLNFPLKNFRRIIVILIIISRISVLKENIINYAWRLLK